MIRRIFKTLQKMPAENCNVCTDFRVLRKSFSKAPIVPVPIANKDPYQPFPCPPDSSELGSSTWTFLHTMAAYYPSSPSIQDKSAMSNMLNALSRFYPCWYCAEHLQTYIESNPPKLESNVELSRWFCEAHNEVNQRTGKPEFDCSKIFERWKDGGPGSHCFE